MKLRVFAIIIVVIPVLILFKFDCCNVLVLEPISDLGNLPYLSIYNYRFISSVQ